MAEQVDDHRRRRPGRHDAPRPLPGGAAPTARSSPSSTASIAVDERHRHRYEVNNAYRDQLAERGPVLLRHLARPQPRRVRRAAARRAPVLRRHAGAPRAALAARPTRTRCSAASSARRSSASRRASSSTSRMAERRRGAATLPTSRVDDPTMSGRDSDLRVRGPRVGRAQRHRRATATARSCAQYVDHPGAVGVLALDDDDRVLLIQQYRHPIRHRDWEIPAGLLDIDGRVARSTAAQRELAEEADLVARAGRCSSSIFTTPGGNDEVAADLPRPRARAGRPRCTRARHEEADMAASLGRPRTMPSTPCSPDGCRTRRCDRRARGRASRAGGWTTLAPADAPGRPASAARPARAGLDGAVDGVPAAPHGRARPRPTTPSPRTVATSAIYLDWLADAASTSPAR